jgi:hypothetical protein
MERRKEKKHEDERPEWMKERDRKFWEEYSQHVRSLTDYWCGTCGMTRMRKNAGEPARCCAKCMERFK